MLPSTPSRLRGDCIEFQASAKRTFVLPRPSLGEGCGAARLPAALRSSPLRRNPEHRTAGGGFGGHPQERRRAKGKAGSVLLAEGLTRSSAPACRCRDPAAHRLPLRTSVLTLRRERYSYRRCCRSACCSRATIAAKARSEAQSQLLPVRQREITESPAGSAGLGGELGSGTSLCARGAVLVSLRVLLAHLFLRNAPHANGAYGPTAETHGPRKAKKTDHKPKQTK